MNQANIKGNVPEKSGVYELKNFGRFVYIGKAKNLKRRLLVHLNDKDPNYYRYETTSWLQSAKSLEDKHLTRYEDKYGRLPRWNSNDTRG